MGTPTLDGDERAAEFGKAGKRLRRKRIHGPEFVWEFVYDPEEQSHVSSGRKTIYQGYYYDVLRKHPRQVEACAAIFSEENIDSSLAEYNALKSANVLGVGPRELEMKKEERVVVDEASGNEVREYRVIIIEEDAGISLERAIRENATIPGPVPMPLHDPKRKPELRAKENAKILFDVFSQLKALHDHDLHHCDLRTANVCVRRHGENPEDIRATLIDFELNANARSTGLSAASPEYYNTIFKRDVNDGNVPRVRPIEMDMGYLAALCYEVETGRPVYETRHLDPSFHNGEDYGFFWLGEDGSVHVMRITQRTLNELARKAGLMPVNAQSMAKIARIDPGIPEPFRSNVLARLSAYANSRVKHGGYLDAKDIAELRADPQFTILCNLYEIAKSEFEGHNSVVRAHGETPEFESFDMQPNRLKFEGMDSVGSYVEDVKLVGYRLIMASDQWVNQKPLPSFILREIEEVARKEHENWLERKRRDGYVLGERCEEPGHLANPNMVEFDELKPLDRAKNIEIVRRIVTNLGKLGILIVR